MNTNLHQTPSDRLSLRPGAALTLDRPHDGYTRLVVDSGRLWLTQSGDAGDHFLGAGDDILLCGAGAVVIECYSAESVRLRVWHAVTLGERDRSVVRPVETDWPRWLRARA